MHVPMPWPTINVAGAPAYVYFQSILPWADYAMNLLTSVSWLYIKMPFYLLVSVHV